MYEEYLLITWPESQAIMEKSWFHKCFLANDLETHPEVGCGAYFVPKVEFLLNDD